MTLPVPMVGLRFGRLLVKAEAGSVRVGHQMKRRVSCVCDCGASYTAIAGHLRNGNTLSCGCLLHETITKHGGYKSAVYKVWHAMLERCRSSTNPAFKDYGGRGITVCDRWQDFAAFRADMGERPPGGMLERNNVDGNYEPGNCRWATAREQANNRRNNTRITAHGVTHTVAEWARVSGLTKSCIFYRLSAGWPHERAVTLKADRTRQHR